jgi:hypothetical protein
MKFASKSSRIEKMKSIFDIATKSCFWALFIGKRLEAKLNIQITNDASSQLARCFEKCTLTWKVEFFFSFSHFTSSTKFKVLQWPGEIKTNFLSNLNS